MSDAKQDQNHVSSKLGVWCVDGTTVITVAIDPATGGFMTDAVSTIGFTPGSIDFKDQNYNSCWMAQNSSDGTTIPIFVNSGGAILVST